MLLKPLRPLPFLAGSFWTVCCLPFWAWAFCCSSLSTSLWSSLSTPRCFALTSTLMVQQSFTLASWESASISWWGFGFCELFHWGGTPFLTASILYFCQSISAQLDEMAFLTELIALPKSPASTRFLRPPEHNGSAATFELTGFPA